MTTYESQVLTPEEREESDRRRRWARRCASGPPPFEKRHLVAGRRYEQSEKGQATRSAYRASAACREARARYEASPKGRAVRDRYEGSGAVYDAPRWQARWRADRKRRCQRIAERRAWLAEATT